MSTTCAGSVCDVIAGYCEECNEFPNLFKGGEFLDYLWDYYLAKNDYVSCGHLVISLSRTAQPKALRVVNSITLFVNTGLYTLFLSEFVLYRQSDQPHIPAAFVLSNNRGINNFIINPQFYEFRSLLVFWNNGKKQGKLHVPLKALFIK